MQDLFSINEIRQLEVIDINTGTKLGFIKDIKIDCDRYKILSILLPDLDGTDSWFSKSEDIEVPFEKIHKLGSDVILIDGSEFFEESVE